MAKHEPGSTPMTFREFNDLGTNAMVLMSTKHIVDGETKTLEDWLGDLCVHALAIDEERNS